MSARPLVSRMSLIFYVLNADALISYIPRLVINACIPVRPFALEQFSSCAVNVRQYDGDSVG